MDRKSEQVQRHFNLIRVEDPRRLSGLALRRVPGEGILIENFCRVVLVDVGQDEVELAIAGIQGTDFTATTTSIERHKLKLHRTYRFDGTDYLINIRHYNRGAMRFTIKCPRDVKVMRDELLTS